MATIVNNPQPVQSRNDGSGFLFGVILLIIVAVALIYFGLPYLRGVSVGPQVNVPSTINVHTSK